VNTFRYLKLFFIINILQQKSYLRKHGSFYVLEFSSNNMTSLEEEFKKLFTSKYQAYANFKTYQGPHITESNKDKDFYNLFGPISSNSLNKEFNKSAKDIIIKDFVPDNMFNHNRLSEQSIHTDKELKENLNELLRKVDNIIEYLQDFHKQIDEKIDKAIYEQSKKR
jgi:hypothetical protein